MCAFSNFFNHADPVCLLSSSFLEREAQRADGTRPCSLWGQGASAQTGQIPEPRLCVALGASSSPLAIPVLLLCLPCCEIDPRLVPGSSDALPTRPAPRAKATVTFPLQGLPHAAWSACFLPFILFPGRVNTCLQAVTCSYSFQTWLKVYLILVDGDWPGRTRTHKQREQVG